MKYKIILLLLVSVFLFSKEMPIVFQGNKYVDQRELYGVLNLYKPYFYEFWKKEPTFDSKTINLAIDTIRNYYKSKGFYHAKIQSKISDKDIEIIIKENEPLHVKLFSVISKFDLTPLIPFKEGSIFDAVKFRKSKKEIKDFFYNKGYCNVDVNAKAWIDLRTSQVYLTYEVKENKPCHFGAITIESPKDIDKDIVKSMLYFKQNQLYSLSKISDSYKNLYAHDGIASAIIDTHNQENSEVNASVSVSEVGKPIRFQTGVGFNSDKGFELGLGVEHRNFLGNLKRVVLNAKYTQIDQSLSTSFDMPLVSGKSAGFGLEFDNQQFLGFKEKKFSGTVFIKQRKTNMTFQESLVYDLPIIYESDDVSLYPEGHFSILSPKFSWMYDTRDNLLEPTHGYFILTDVMGSLQSSLSDATYYKYNLAGGYIVPVLTSIIALKANFSSMHVFNGDIPSSYYFFAGGMSSNRAYSYQKLGPRNSIGDPTGLNSVLNLTAEYRFPIYGKFGGVLFSDNTFISQNNSIPDFSRIYDSIGFGLRYKTPVGPVVLDLGFDLKHPTKQYAIHFRIGESF